MDVKDECAALLSNYEVYALLKDIKDGRGYHKPAKNQPQLSTIVYETKQYLDDSPCSSQTAENVRAFVRAVESFGLTKAEKLQLLNLQPTSAVELQLLIEECEERLDESQQERLLEVIAATLPVRDEEMEQGCGNSPVT